MLRLLAEPEQLTPRRVSSFSGVPAVRAVPRPAVVRAPAPHTIRKAPRRWRVRQFFKNLFDGSLLVPLYARLARRLGLLVAYSELTGLVLHADGSATDYGLLGRRVITTAGVAWLATAFNNTVEPETMNYHGFGTGTAAESAAHTALVTELTTEYVTNNTRPTGSQSTSTNTYVTAGTLSPDSGGTLAITEHGLFNQAATGGGTMFDRTVFSAVNVAASADSLLGTYTLTLPSGG